jgi:outer membrane protein assembly factor BamE
MINTKLFSLLFSGILLGGCNLVYKQSVQQGNAIEQDAVDDLSLGMSKRQVNLIMGTPAIHDPFHVDRWDYIYTFRPRNNDGSQRNISLYFEDGELAKIDDKGFRNTGQGTPIIIPESEENEPQDESETADSASIAATVESEPGEQSDAITVPAVALVEAPQAVSVQADPGRPEVPAGAAEEDKAAPQGIVTADLAADEFYTVQLGIFTEHDNARALSELITNAGHEAVIDELSEQEPVRYRVRSGKFSDSASADALVETLDTATGHYGFVLKIEDPEE